MDVPERKRFLSLIALCVGCSLAWVSTSWTYFNAMGLSINNTGYVTKVTFMLAACISAVLVAIVIICWAKKAKALISSKVIFVAAGIMSIGVLLGNWFTNAGVSSELIAILLGFCYTCGNVVFDVSWLSKLLCNRDRTSTLTLVAACIVSVVVLLAIAPLGYSTTTAVIMVVFTFLSALLYSLVNDGIEKGLRFATIEKESPIRQKFLSTLLCLLVCEFLLAVANVAIYNSTFSSIMGSVNMDYAAAIAVLLVLLIYVVGNQRVDLYKAYKLCMPFMLIVFSLMPFFAQQMTIGGYVMVVCWNFLGIACAIYLVEMVRSESLNPVLYFAISLFAAEITLAAGIGVGLFLNAVSATYDFSLLTMLLAVAVYPLGLVLLYVQSKGGGRGAESESRDSLQLSDDNVAPVNSGEGNDPFESLLQSRMESFAQKYGLTPREKEICLYLARGRSVKTISQGLFISDNTVWSHIKNMYVKCDVKSKQELMGRIEDCLSSADRE